MALLLFEPFRIAAGKESFNSIRKLFEDEVGVASILPGYEPFTTYTIGYRTIDECYVFPSKDLAQRKFDSRLNDKTGYRFIKPVQWQPSGDVTGLGGGAKKKQAGQLAKQSTASPDEESGKRAAEEAEQARIKACEQRDAEFQAKLAAHEAAVAEYEREVAEREAEIARQQQEHKAAQEAAARLVEAHQRELEEANRRQREYEAAKRRHMQCLSWDREACDAIAAGKPALEEIADAGQASTDTDANRCVTTAEVRTNASFQGNTAASVMNGCGQKVDVRICLKRPEGWNCGTVWGVNPQARASHSSFNATGEVFVDARTTGSNRPLATPGG